MRFEIARSLNGDKIMYIARDTGGIVRLRGETEEKLIKAIKEYNEMLAAQALEKAKAKTKATKGKGVSVRQAQDESVKDKEETPIEEAETTQEATIVETESSEPVPEGKKLLQNELKAQIEEKKARSGKKSFWDKLK